MINKVLFYKETKFKEIPELGIKVPKDWEVVRLGDNRVSLKIKSGTTPSKRKEEYWNGNIPFVTIGDMTKVYKYLIDTENKITELALKDSQTFLVPEENILLSMYGTIGKVVINKKPVAISQNIAGIIVNKQHTDIQYLFYALQHYSCQFERAKIITLRHLDIKMVKNSLVPLPSLKEQKAIAEILSTIDKAIEKTQEAIEKTEKLKKGLMQKLLTGEIRIKEENEKWIFYREAKFKEIPELGIKVPKDWVGAKLENVWYDNDVYYGLTAKAVDYKTKYKLIRITDVSNGIIRWDTLPYCEVTEKTKNINKYLIKKGDLLITRSGTVGIVVYIDREVNNVLFGSYLIKLKFKNKIYPLYFYYFSQSDAFRKQIESKKAGGVQKNLSKSRLKDVIIITPSLEEQKRIAEVLMTVDKKIDLLKKKKELLEKVKKWFMQKLLTGELRVKNI